MCLTIKMVSVKYSGGLKKIDNLRHFNKLDRVYRLY